MRPVVAPAGLNSSSLDPPVYFSELYVRKDSSFYEFEDLKGSIFAYNDETSLSGYYCMQFLLLARSQKTPSKSVPFFTKLIKTGSHVNSVAAVLDGRADVLALDRNVLAALQGDIKGRDKLQSLRPIPVDSLECSVPFPRSSSYSRYVQVSSLGFLGPHPAQPVVVSRRLGADLIDAITEALLNVPTTVMKGIRSDRYVPVDSNYYDDITSMIAACDELDLLGNNYEELS